MFLLVILQVKEFDAGCLFAIFRLGTCFTEQIFMFHCAALYQRQCMEALH